MNKTYDPNNIFAKILSGEIPCQPVFENDHVFAFKDIWPKAPVHILLIPKGSYRDATDFSKSASVDEVVAFTRAIATITDMFQLTENGYRLIANTGKEGGQEVPHFHIHILGGKVLGPMVS